MNDVHAFVSVCVRVYNYKFVIFQVFKALKVNNQVNLQIIQLTDSLDKVPVICTKYTKKTCRWNWNLPWGKSYYQMEFLLLLLFNYLTTILFFIWN